MDLLEKRKPRGKPTEKKATSLGPKVLNLLRIPPPPGQPRTFDSPQTPPPGQPRMFDSPRTPPPVQPRLFDSPPMTPSEEEDEQSKGRRVSEGSRAVESYGRRHGRWGSLQIPTERNWEAGINLDDYGSENVRSPPRKRGRLEATGENKGGR